MSYESGTKLYCKSDAMSIHSSLLSSGDTTSLFAMLFFPLRYAFNLQFFSNKWKIVTTVITVATNLTRGVTEMIIYFPS